MPDQPADPIHYDMRIPPEPKHKDENRDVAKKHSDKINTEPVSDEKNAGSGEKENR